MGDLSFNAYKPYLSYKQMVEDGPEEFKVHTDIYLNPQIFEDEIHRIFEKSWVYVAHESEMPHPGDYVTTFIGRQPVIISRSQDDEVHVLLNSCRHRGNVVCRDERGHSDQFRCPYHGWVYDNSGALVGLAEIKGYEDGFQTKITGLIKVPRVGRYRGLIFASLSPHGEALEQHLGEAKKYVDLWVERSPAGKARLLYPHKFIYSGNWKFQADNGHDSYHGRYVHESAIKTLNHALGQPPLDERKSAQHGQGYVRGFARGHGLLERPGTRGELPAELLEDYNNRMKEIYGAERFEQITMVRHTFIFPNLYLMDDNVRVIHPISENKTVVYSYFASLDGVSDKINNGRLKNLQWRLGQTGFFATDDMEMFVGCQTGVHASAMEWLNFSRGLHREVNHPNEKVGLSSDETPQRALYRQWVHMMSESSI